MAAENASGLRNPISRSKSFDAGALLLALIVVVWIRQLPLGLPSIDPALRAPLTYPGADGVERAYLGDFDSYVWLRNARNYLQTGTTCDEWRDGECRDTLTLAPVGGRMRYARSPHLLTIAAIHRVLSWFTPNYPLMASAFWCQVLLGALAAAIAFCAGRPLGGAPGGFVAAILAATTPIFLERSLGNDNDPWNVVLPLAIVAASLAAIRAQKVTACRAWTLTACACTVLYAATWRGWIFTAAVTLVGFTVAAALTRRRRTIEPLALYGALTIACLFATEVDPAALFNRPWEMVRPIVQSAASEDDAAQHLRDVPWPDSLLAVGELIHPTMSEVFDLVGGRLVFAIALTGVCLIPVRKFGNAATAASAAAAALVFLGADTVDAYGRVVLVAIVAVPIVTFGLIGIRDTTRAGTWPATLALLAAWTLGALFLCFSGRRFVLLLGPPIAIGAAAAVGAVFARVRSDSRIPGALKSMLTIGVASAVIAMPLRAAYSVAVAYQPRMNDAWWGALTKIRKELPPETIVSTWWDYGYFVKFFAERRTSMDGGTLNTHVAHWFAKALLSPTEAEAIGLMRMLDCGSDATPEPEQARGAFWRLVESGIEQIRAHEVLLQIAPMNADDAGNTLTALGLTGERKSQVLEASHCAPPPAVVVLTSEMVSTTAWRLMGGWDPRRAILLDRAATTPESVLVPELESTLGLTRGAATVWYRRASGRKSEATTRDLIAPRGSYLTPDWVACTPAGTNTSMLRCPLPVGLVQGGVHLDGVFVDPATPERLRISYSQSSGKPTTAAPELVVAAGSDWREVWPLDGQLHEVGVIFDVERSRVLVGSPELLRSVFTRMMFLDGRYLRRLTKWDDRTGNTTERVTTWEIRW